MRRGLWGGLLLFATLGLRAGPEVPAELRAESFLRELFFHAYHWYLDDRFFAEQGNAADVEIRIRMVTPTLDEGDRSAFADVVLPAAGLVLHLKRSDYAVPELDLHVRDEQFRVVGAQAWEEANTAEDFVGVTLNRATLEAWLDEQRERRHEFSDDELAEVRDVMRDWLRAHVDEPPGRGGHRFYLAARTPVSGDVWVYWPEGKLALRLAGELGFEEGRLAAHLPLHVEVYHLQRHVVASLHERPGANLALTKDWAGRVLYECLVRGQAVEWEW